MKISRVYWPNGLGWYFGTVGHTRGWLHCGPITITLFREWGLAWRRCFFRKGKRWNTAIDIGPFGFYFHPTEWLPWKVWR